MLLAYGENRDGTGVSTAQSGSHWDVDTELETGRTAAANQFAIAAATLVTDSEDPPAMNTYAWVQQVHLH
jgi:hypothetical protein